MCAFPATRAGPRGVALAGGTAAAAAVDARRLSRLPSLTGMRFFAATAVFVSHITTLHEFANQRIESGLSLLAPRLGNAGVEFFFILSGFVLTWSARPDDTARSFWWRRAVKIYPNNLVACALALVGLLATGRAVTTLTTVPNLFLVQDWWPNVPLSGGLNRPSWSLACEVLFYLTFPLVLPSVRRVPERLLWPLAAAVVALVAVVPEIARLLSTGGPYQYGVPWAQYWFVYVFPFSRLLEFVLGIVLARILLAGRWIGLGLGAATVLAIGAFAVTELTTLRFALVATMIVPLALVIGAGAAADQNGTPSPVRGRVAVWLGEVSFAFYIMHYLVLQFGHELLGAPQWSWPVAVAAAVVYFCVALGLAHALYLSVERPLVRAAARRARRTRRPAPA